MSGTIITPGIHCFTSTADLAAGSSVTLSGAGVYIFRVPAGLTLNVGSSIVLAGADPCSVFWQVGTAATLNSINSVGNVDAQAGVTLGVGDQLTGRAMSTVGPVTLSGNNTSGGCSTPASVPPVCPTITLSPSTLPGGYVGIAYTRTDSWEWRRGAVLVRCHVRRVAGWPHAYNHGGLAGNANRCRIVSGHDTSNGREWMFPGDALHDRYCRGATGAACVSDHCPPAGDAAKRRCGSGVCRRSPELAERRRTASA